MTDVREALRFDVWFHEETGNYTAACAKYPSLSHTATTWEAAMLGILELVMEVEIDEQNPVN